MIFGNFGIKEKIATFLWNIHIRTVWVHRNAKLFLQAGKEVSWNQLYDKDHDYPYYFDNGVDVFPRVVNIVPYYKKLVADIAGIKQKDMENVSCRNSIGSIRNMRK